MRRDRYQSASRTVIMGFLLSVCGLMASAHAQTVLLGEVMAGAEPLAGAQVALFAAREDQSVELAQGETDARGQFAIYAGLVEGEDELYLIVTDSDSASGSLVLMSAIGRVGSEPVVTVRVNERTTVASVYALSRFIHEDLRVYGRWPGLGNSFATVRNLVDPETSAPGVFVSNADNSGEGGALETIETIAGLVAACANDQSGQAACQLFEILTPRDSRAPADTVEAIHNLARSPASYDNAGIYSLSRSGVVGGRGLGAAPTSFVVALHYTAGGFNAPGRMAFDAEGRVWSNNNYNLPIPMTKPGTQIVVLSPTGVPILGSPIHGAGIRGMGWGTAVAADGSCWLSSFIGGGISRFSSEGHPTFHAPARFGDLNHPMGIAFDQDGNLWIVNLGEPGDFSSPGSVTVYPNGDPKRAVSTSLSIAKPFAVQIDGDRRAWITNAEPGNGGVVVLKFENGELVQEIMLITSPGLIGAPDPVPIPGIELYPKGLALDSGGNAWVSNWEPPSVTFIGPDGTANDLLVGGALSGPWGIAVDGGDHVWIAEFLSPAVVEVCGHLGGTCPGGASRGDVIARYEEPSFAHLTAVQIDSSGNVWVANNFALGTTPTHVIGGDGLVELIGVASPVKTPLLGLPESP